jgi:putative ubiquitin-RnfH superfamily antitoxin RatB of RatAB toxin-antitoxin module
MFTDESPITDTYTVIVSMSSRQVREIVLPWSPGLTAGRAIALARHILQDPQLNQAIEEGRLGWSIWGKRVRPDTVMKTLDRLELTRPLRVDPKIARRERFQKQGSRGAGLFALQRNKD